MSRDIQMLQNHKADATKIVSMKPHDSEGNNGDLAVGDTSGGVSLFMKVKNKWYEISSDETMESTTTIKGTVAYIKHGYDAAANPTPTDVFIPMDFVSDYQGYPGDINNVGVRNPSMAFILPYDCRVLTLQVRSTEVLGTTYAKLYTTEDGNEMNSEDELVVTTKTVNMALAATIYTLEFNRELILPAGNLIAIRLLSTGDQLDMVAMTTLDFDVII